MPILIAGPANLAPPQIFYLDVPRQEVIGSMIRINGVFLGCGPLPGCQWPPGLFSIFRIGDPNLNLYLPLASWEGGHIQGISPNYLSILSNGLEKWGTVKKPTWSDHHWSQRDQRDIQVSPKWGCGTPSKFPKWLLNGDDSNYLQVLGWSSKWPDFPCYQVTIKPKPIIGTAHATKCRRKFTLEGCSGSAWWLDSRKETSRELGLYFGMAANMEVEHKITAGSWKCFLEKKYWYWSNLKYIYNIYIFMLQITSVGINIPKQKAIESEGI